MFGRMVAGFAIAVGACAAVPTPWALADVSGSPKDWIASLCSGETFPTQTRIAVAGTSCALSDNYVVFDQFASEADRELLIQGSRGSYWAKTTVGGKPFLIWIPGSRSGGAELAPLKQFGFTIDSATGGGTAAPDTGSGSVPNLVSGSVLGQPCSNFHKYVFGRGADGTWMACGTDGVGNGAWGRSVPVVGVRGIGSSCDPSASLAAQAPDGRGMVCGGQGWVPGP